MSGAWPWLAVILLGAYHGLDPSMGWLFAVALGLQEQRRSKVVAALLPIAIGHFLSISVVVALVATALLQSWRWLRPAGALLLILFGGFRLWRPRAHPRWVAMKVNSADLVGWSFLMTTAHGAGLMLFPILLGISAAASAGSLTDPAMHPRAMCIGGTIAQSSAAGGMVVLLHTGATFLTMGAVALLVYEWLGLRILRSAWVNLELIWAGALIAAGLFSLIT